MSTSPLQFVCDPGLLRLKGIGMTFWDFFWLMISFLLYVSYLVVLFRLFRIESVVSTAV